jgi:hypothetical protein
MNEFVFERAFEIRAALNRLSAAKNIRPPDNLMLKAARRSHLSGERREHIDTLGPTRACRKSNPNIFVVQSAEDWAAKNTPCPLHGAR